MEARGRKAAVAYVTARRKRAQRDKQIFAYRIRTGLHPALHQRSSLYWQSYKGAYLKIKGGGLGKPAPLSGRYTRSRLKVQHQLGCIIEEAHDDLDARDLQAHLSFGLVTYKQYQPKLGTLYECTLVDKRTVCYLLHI